MDFQAFVLSYSPWRDPSDPSKWEAIIPPFRRPVFESLAADLYDIDQIISITGPRRVGKSTLLRQLVQYLIREKQVAPSEILYYSFDDPALFRRNANGGDLLESLMEHLCKSGAVSYLFLDEIQTLDRWELYLKKYYDLKYPVRMVVSGSASSPIFKKSRESLLGRVKDYHVLPFSFREFLLYKLAMRPELLQEMDHLKTTGDQLKGMFARHPEHIDTTQVAVPPMSDSLWDEAAKVLRIYLVDGGFPEVWTLPTAEKKIEYLYDNQVKKVIYEDLVLATEFRKPEQLKMFYISLLERPGQEVSLTSLSQDIGVNVQQIDKYLPLLEMTDLISHASKFRNSPLRVRQGNRKYYLIDLAMRNAVLRIGEELLDDDDMLGLYAENLVFNALKKWPRIIQIDYYRENKREVDFIVHTKPSRYLPVEVKYRRQWGRKDIEGVHSFRYSHPCHPGIIVTREREDFGFHDLDLNPSELAFRIPLVEFLLMFD